MSDWVPLVFGVVLGLAGIAVVLLLSLRAESKPKAPSVNNGIAWDCFGDSGTGDELVALWGDRRIGHPASV